MKIDKTKKEDSAVEVLVGSTTDKVSKTNIDIIAEKEKETKFIDYSKMSIKDFIENIDRAEELSKSIYRDVQTVHYYSKDIAKIAFVADNKELEDLIKIDFKCFVITVKQKNGVKKQVLNLPFGFISKVKQLNTIDMIVRDTNFFQSEKIKIEKQGSVLYITKNYIEYRNINFLDVSEDTKKNILNEYRDHWHSNFEEVLEWIVNCRFSNSRRESYLHLRVNAGFGKSFFMSVFKELGLFVECDYEDFKNPSPLDPILFENSIGMVVDEFTIFKQEFKKLTHNMSLTAKYKLKTEVPLYAKLFLSAEHSPSFTDGVDKQITDRVASLDFEGKNLNNLELFQEHGNIVYFSVIKEYCYNFIVNKINEMIELGEINSSNKADIAIKSFHSNHRLNVEDLNLTIKKMFFKKTYELINAIEEDLDKREREILNKIIVIDNNVYIKSFKSYFEDIIKLEDDNFYKKARYKTNSIFEILNVKSKSHRVNSKVLTAVKLEMKEIEENVQGFLKDETIKEVNEEFEAEAEEIF